MEAGEHQEVKRKEVKVEEELAQVGRSKLIHLDGLADQLGGALKYFFKLVCPYFSLVEFKDCLVFFCLAKLIPRRRVAVISYP